MVWTTPRVARRGMKNMSCTSQVSQTFKRLDGHNVSSDEYAPGIKAPHCYINGHHPVFAARCGTRTKWGTAFPSFCGKPPWLCKKPIRRLTARADVSGSIEDRVDSCAVVWCSQKATICSFRRTAESFRCRNLHEGGEYSLAASISCREMQPWLAGASTCNNMKNFLLGTINVNA